VNPVTFLVTGPLRWLPAPAIPFALNLFSAVCAALALGLLARSWHCCRRTGRTRSAGAKKAFFHF